MPTNEEDLKIADDLDAEAVELFLEQYRERFKIERHDGAPRGIQVVMVGDPIPDRDMLFLRERLAKGGIELVIPALMTPEERKARQVAILDSGHARLAEVLARAMKDMSLTYEPSTEDFHIAAQDAEPKIERTAAPRNQHSFKSYQNQFKGKGPPVRQAFAKIRPPRRGGRS